MIWALCLLLFNSSPQLRHLNSSPSLLFHLVILQTLTVTMLALNLLPVPIKMINELLWKAVLRSSHYHSNSKFETSPSNCANSKPFHSCHLLFPPPEGLVIITAGVCSSQQCLPTFIFHSHSDAEYMLSKREGGGTLRLTGFILNHLYFH